MGGKKITFWHLTSIFLSNNLSLTGWVVFDVTTLPSGGFLEYIHGEKTVQQFNSVQSL